MVVVQDVRGRYTSEGEWYPFKHETDDGYDTVEWAAALPHSNGKVGMFGGSYVGATQMLAAIGHPPHLAGICPVVTASNYHENWTYQGGAFEQWFNESWTSGLAQDTLNRVDPREHQRRDRRHRSAAEQLSRLQRSAAARRRSSDHGACSLLPRLARPSHLRQLLEAVVHRRKLRQHPGSRAHRRRLVRHLPGRFAAQLHGHCATTPATRPLATGSGCSSIIGGHAGGGRKIGEVDFGPDAAEFDEDDIMLDWYDYLFHGKQNQFADASKPVRIFVMGKNKWRNEDAWPLRARQGRTSYYLHSAGKANSASQAMACSPRPPRKRNRPTPTSTIPPTPCPPSAVRSAAMAIISPPARAIRSKSKTALTCSSTPRRRSTQDTEVTGPVTLDLYAKTSAVDTDFTAKLVDVWPRRLRA